MADDDAAQRSLDSSGSPQRRRRRRGTGGSCGDCRTTSASSVAMSLATGLPPPARCCVHCAYPHVWRAAADAWWRAFLAQTRGRSHPLARHRELSAQWDRQRLLNAKRWHEPVRVASLEAAEALRKRENAVLASASGRGATLRNNDYMPPPSRARYQLRHDIRLRMTCCGTGN